MHGVLLAVRVALPNVPVLPMGKLHLHGGLQEGPRHALAAVRAHLMLKGHCGLQVWHQVQVPLHQVRRHLALWGQGSALL